MLSAAQYFVAGAFIERHLNELESADAFSRLTNLHHALDVMQEDLTATTADWAQREDMYSFVAHRTSQSSRELDPSALVRLRLSFLIVLTPHGQIAFAKALAADGVAFDEVPSEILGHSEADGALGIVNDEVTLTGLIAGANDVYLVSSQPVRGARGEPNGRLIMGRSLQDIVTPALARMTGQSLRAERNVAIDASTAHRVQGREALRIDAQSIEAVTPLDDLWGREIAQVRISTERSVQSLLSEARLYLLLATLFIGFVFGAIALALIRARVVVPLEALEKTVAAIGEQGHPAARVELKRGAREFRTLSASINAMLHQLEQQQAMRRDRDAALEANRLKSEFLATMSHEIRTPMNGVLGMCELLQRTELNPKQRHLSDTILRSARSLLDILNDILDFSKIEAGKLDLDASPFSPAEVLHTVAAPFVAAAQAKGIEFVVRIESGVPPGVIGDAVRLRQILNNLLSNALKFTAQGSITVSCALVRSEGDTVELRYMVADTGIGVSIDARERIFEPFAQAESSTTRRFGGTGLGLAIVRRLVGLMGGVIELRSEPGVGSTFVFTTVSQRAPEETLQQLAMSDVTSSRISLGLMPSVLLAEDNAVNREVLVEMLQHIGCYVTAVENGAQVLAAVATHRYHVVLMDCQMPVMDGPTAAKELRSLERATHQEPTLIIALTADATPENRRRCFEAGMDTVVIKPITQAQLRNLLLQVVRPPALATS